MAGTSSVSSSSRRPLARKGSARLMLRKGREKIKQAGATGHAKIKQAGATGREKIKQAGATGRAKIKQAGATGREKIRQAGATGLRKASSIFSSPTDHSRSDSLASSSSRTSTSTSSSSRTSLSSVVGPVSITSVGPLNSLRRCDDCLMDHPGGGISKCGSCGRDVCTQCLTERRFKESLSGLTVKLCYTCFGRSLDGVSVRERLGMERARRSHWLAGQRRRLSACKARRMLGIHGVGCGGAVRVTSLVAPPPPEFQFQCWEWKERSDAVVAEMRESVFSVGPHKRLRASSCPGHLGDLRLVWRCRSVLERWISTREKLGRSYALACAMNTWRQFQATGSTGGREEGDNKGNNGEKDGAGAGDEGTAAVKRNRAALLDEMKLLFALAEQELGA